MARFPGSFRTALAASVLLVALGTPGATYHGGRSGGGIHLFQGDSVRFDPGNNPAPDALWIEVLQGQGNAIVQDGAGHLTGSDFYLRAGQLLVFATTPPYTLYFQGASVDLAFGGTVVNRPAAPVCNTGSSGPVLLQVNRLLNIHLETRQTSSPKVDVTAFAATAAVRSGDLDFFAAGDPRDLGYAVLPTCSDPNCCSPDAPVFPVKNLSGGPYTFFEVASRGGFAFDWKAEVPPPLVCTASASPTSGTAPVTVAFSASASGGSPGYSWAWNFGDGGRSTEKNPTHTYRSGGTFTWKVTVTDGAGVTASKTGTVKVTAPLTVTASANPRQGAPPLTVAFSCSPKGGTAPYSYLWDFGDGGTSTLQAPTHTYGETGAHTWVVTVTDAQGRTAAASDTVYAGIPIPPRIDAVQVLTSPFRLKVTGADFASNASVFLDGTAAPSVTVKSSSKILLGGGQALKNLVPKGQTVLVTVVNPDGGTSDPYPFTR
ncbi:MAG: PKD domain-containing protein [Acidobacteriota bacterium]